MTKDIPDWKPFDGEYDKKGYDVLLPDGTEVLWCWPNAGFMNATDGSGRMWGPGECQIRESICDHRGRIRKEFQ